jgi:hypothetical protein
MMIWIMNRKFSVFILMKNYSFDKFENILSWNQSLCLVIEGISTGELT